MEKRKKKIINEDRLEKKKRKMETKKFFDKNKKKIWKITERLMI